MTRSERELRDKLKAHVATCEEKAREAVVNGSPVGAREWFEAASAGLRAIREVEGRPS